MSIQLETLTTLAGIAWNNLLRASLHFAVFALLLWLVCRLLQRERPARLQLLSGGLTCCEKAQSIQDV
jgi:hypothetical protein